MKFISKILLFIVFISQLSAQDDSIINDNSYLLSRSRILFGYSTLIQKDEKPELKNIFMNINYRTSGFDSFAKPFRIKWAFETGLSGLDLQDKDLQGIALLPYVKTGPEMSLLRNLFIGGSIGMASLVLNYFAVFLYGGINSYYLIPLNKTLFLEIELGYHTTFFLEKTPYLIYFSTGIGIK